MNIGTLVGLLQLELEAARECATEPRTRAPRAPGGLSQSDRVVEAVRAAGTPLPVKDIAARSGVPIANVYALSSPLVRDGRLERDRSTFPIRYRIPD